MRNCAGAHVAAFRNTAAHRPLVSSKYLPYHYTPRSSRPIVPREGDVFADSNVDTEIKADGSMGLIVALYNYVAINNTAIVMQDDESGILFFVAVFCLN